jgi:hypothetical protein
MEWNFQFGAGVTQNARDIAAIDVSFEVGHVWTGAKVLQHRLTVFG